MISVVIPTYNSARLLSKCLTAIFHTNYSDFEVIVVDDCSQDDTEAVVKSFEGASYLRLEHNSGPGIARNMGAKIAKGSIIAFLDADCVPPQNWLLNIHTFFEKHHDAVGMASTYSHAVDPQSMLEVFQHDDIWYRQKDLEGEIHSFSSANFAVRRLAFERCGGFPEYRVNEDMELGMLLSRSGKILWDKSNRVGHHFRSNIRGYLKQQYCWTKAIMMSQLKSPAVLTSKNTYNPFTIFIELALLIFIVCAVLFSIPVSALGLTVFILWKMPYLRWIYRTSQQKNLRYLAFVVGITIVRNMAWIFGLLVGTLSFSYVMTHNCARGTIARLNTKR